MGSKHIFLQPALLSVLLGGSAFGQASSRLGPLERPARAETRTAPAMPASFQLGVSTPAPYRLGAVRQAELDAVERLPQLPLMGIERPLDAAPQARGEWLATDGGKAVWRTAIQSDGAFGVRVHFHDFAVGGGAVWVYSEDRRQVFGPYTGTGIDETGDFWSHTVFADTAVVEYLADQPAQAVPFSITRIAHLMASEQTYVGRHLRARCHLLLALGRDRERRGDVHFRDRRRQLPVFRGPGQQQQQRLQALLPHRQSLHLHRKPWRRRSRCSGNTRLPPATERRPVYRACRPLWARLTWPAPRSRAATSA